MAPVPLSGAYAITDINDYPVGLDLRNMDRSDNLPIVSSRDNRLTAWHLEQITPGRYRFSVSTLTTPLEPMPVAVNPQATIEALVHTPVIATPDCWALEELVDGWYIIKHADDVSHVWEVSAGLPGEPNEIVLASRFTTSPALFKIKPLGA